MSEHRTQDQSAVIALLRDASAFPDGADCVEVVETHAALVFLAGEYAYKLKRAVKYPYLDFSSSQQRKKALLRELEINAPTAPGLYLAVLPVTADQSGLRLSGSGPPVDFVLKMRRFDRSEELDQVAHRGDFTADLARDLGRVVAKAHQQAPRRDRFDFSSYLRQIIIDNHTSLEEDPDLFDPAAARVLTDRALEMLNFSGKALAGRRSAGLVRRCHGDLHLKNIVRIDGAPVLFDALELDEDLATMDVAYDLAYLLMDMWFEGLKSAANRLFNAYCVATPNSWRRESLHILPLLLAVRATIRAKVDAAIAHLEADPMRRRDRSEAVGYFQFAERLVHPPSPCLVAIGGLSGTGKTTLGREIADKIGPVPGALHLRSDVIRKSLFNTAPEQHLPERAYHPGVDRLVFDVLCRQAGEALAQGHAVIADAVFAHCQDRENIEAVAREKGVPFKGLWLQTDLTLRQQRVSNRRNDASDANVEIATRQEDYQTGTVDWHHLDVGGGLAQSVGKALEALRVSESLPAD